MGSEVPFGKWQWTDDTIVEAEAASGVGILNIKGRHEQQNANFSSVNRRAEAAAGGGGR